MLQQSDRLPENSNAMISVGWPPVYCWLRRERRRLQKQRWGILLTAFATGCSRSPSQDILGSFFPAWMLCAVIGILSSVIIRKVLVLARFEAYVVQPPLTYSVLAVAVTLLVWLIWFGG